MTPPPLNLALEDLSANILAAVLQAAGVGEMPKFKQDKIRLWLNLVGDPLRIQRALAGLSPTQRRALEILQIGGNEIRTDLFRGRLARAGVVLPYDESFSDRTFRVAQTLQTPKPAPTLPTFATLLQELLLTGLIWTHGLHDNRVGSKLDFRGGRYVYIPEEVVRHLPPPPIRESAPPPIVQTLESSARTCQREIYLLWSATRETPLHLINSGLLRVSDLKRMAGQLLVTETIVTGSKESDYRRLFFLRRLAAALDVLRVDPAENQITAQPTPTFISQPPPQRVRLSFQRWRDGDWWNELLATVPSTMAPSAALIVSAAPAPVSSARRTVLSTLALLVQHAESQQNGSAAWVSIEAVSAYLRDHNDEFLVTETLTGERARGYSYYYSNQGTINLRYEYNSLNWSWPQHTRNEEAGWKEVEGAFIRSVLTEGLYWLGLVDLGYAKPVTPQGGAAPDDVVAVRLTDMGRWLLLNGPQPEIPEESGRVVVQPNFRIFAFDPISDTVLARLDSFANRQNAARAIEYELSRDSLYRAQLTGQNAAQIQQWLEQVTGAALPQNVARSLAEWQAAFERITVHSRVGWLEAATPALIDALLGDSRWSKAIVRRATPTGLMVRADRIDEMEQALLAAGELPARHGDPESASRASITVKEDGRIVMPDRAPSFYIYSYLRSFCEQGPAGWQITAASVAQASAAGLDAAAILARLEAMAANDVPPALQEKIKTWSRHYGAARVQTVTLVQFRDQDVLNDLWNDPSLARLLKPFKPEARLGLAVLAPADVAAATALLRERGVDVQT